VHRRPFQVQEAGVEAGEAFGLHEPMLGVGPKPRYGRSSSIRIRLNPLPFDSVFTMRT
jgi:hypothetical protein